MINEEKKETWNILVPHLHCPLKFRPQSTSCQHPNNLRKKCDAKLCPIKQEKEEETVKEIIELAQILTAIKDLNINSFLRDRLTSKLEENLKEYEKGVEETTR